MYLVEHGDEFSTYRAARASMNALPDGGIPFDISLNKPNKETVAAKLEADRIGKDSAVKGYTDLSQLFADLKE